MDAGPPSPFPLPLRHSLQLSPVDPWEMEKHFADFGLQAEFVSHKDALSLATLAQQDSRAQYLVLPQARLSSRPLIHVRRAACDLCSSTVPDPSAYLTPVSLDDESVCAGSFLLSVGAGQVNRLIGDNVMRSFYTIYGSSDFDFSGNMTTPTPYLPAVLVIMPLNTLVVLILVITGIV
ncbi:hypothetical protein L227DRAFT_611374 [Lentinus tigrinus ALCF2SS1-6]|uniref:Uncharacterized protein n=1 Tax=Lentinus tigrinus ALCF2SS1-6 TaxID=1328759 RepID=A0A5C2S9B7_9APHY|nr:hypothetical protein L227DRAFT_611374 [Lentinus tigrinus ALCF2SS1-6]